MRKTKLSGLLTGVKDNWMDDIAVSKNLIYKELRRSIIMGHRKPGDRLNSSEIADTYSTSITPVRDALQMLSQDGLVMIKPRSGYFVTELTLKQLRDLLDLRRVLEVAAIERSVPRISQDQTQALRKVHAGYTGDDDLSYDRYTDENRNFHYLLARASGNLELADTLGRLMDRLARFMVMRQAGKIQLMTHKRIVDALEAHDLDKARQALLDDIDPSRDAILDTVMDEEASGWHVSGWPRE
ncbi:MAG: GntR family transcriptional regulator [Anaerolineales bacterium]|nr:GntR family transcriptional regulator [Anaerolineales bacterium]